MALLETLMQDFRYGLRMLVNSPAFTGIIVLILGVSIGANTALFSVVNAVVLRPLPYKDASRVVAVWDRDPHGGRNGYSAATLLERRDGNRVFDGFSGWATAAFAITGRDAPERVDGLLVSWDFFKTLGVMPLLGRTFSPEDDRPGAPRVAVLSHELWQRRFAGDREAVGRTLSVNGQPCTVIGIMPSRFRFYYRPEMWMPLAINRATASRDVVYLSVVARLAPGMSLSGAQARWGGLVEPMRAATRQGRPKGLLLLFAAVGLLLLIACVNVANLLMARASVRHAELTVRASLGAGRSRLMRQLLTESVLLALPGGVLGLLLAYWLIQFLPALVPPVLLSGSSEIALDGLVFVFTGTLSVVTGLVFGVAPALWASTFDLNEALKEGGRGNAGGLRQGRFRSALVITEVALSLVLLVCAGLLVRSLFAMQRVDLGFRPAHVLTMRMSPLEGRYSSPASLRAYYRQALETVGAIAGVRSASVSLGQAPWDTEIAGEFDIAGHPRHSASDLRAAAFETVSPDYFQTLGIALRKGRFFTERDDETSPRVVIVNRKFVTMYSPHEEPLGKQLLIQELTGARQVGRKIAMEIVAVVDDIKFGGPAASGVPMVYMPILQSPLPGAALALRTPAEPMQLAGTVRAVLAQLDHETPITHIKSMDQIVTDSMSQAQTQTWLVGVFATVALVLAALGNYGVISYFVAQSTHDIGIRMALGASTRDVLNLVLRHGMLLVGIGLLVGLSGAFALTRFVSTLLFEVKPADPWTFAGASLLLALVAFAAAFIPAWRATRVDPVSALRCE